MSAGIPNVKLNNGLEMPVFGLATWQNSSGRGTEVDQIVKTAISLGYRLFDCSPNYGSEKLIGKAFQEKIEQGVIKRNDLFIISKLRLNNQRADVVESLLLSSLKNLQTTYLDLYLLEFQQTEDLYLENSSTKNIVFSSPDYLDMWKAVESVYKKKLIRAIGLSNFNCEEIDKILGICTVMPQIIEVECHPFLNQRKLRKYCESNGLVMMSHTPFGGSDAGSSNLLSDPKIKKISERYGKPPAQILLKYNIQLGNIVIRKNFDNNRLWENMQIFDFYLAPEDMSYINSFDSNNSLTY